MVWSGVAGPTWESAPASFEPTNSRTSGASSKWRMARRFRLTSPRRAGPMASATSRRSADGSGFTRRRPRVGPERVCHVLGQEEPRAPVRNRDHVLAVHLLDHLAAAVGVGEGDDGVGVGVDDRLVREGAVEQRLGAGAWA